MIESSIDNIQPGGLEEYVNLLSSYIAAYQPRALEAQLGKSKSYLNSHIRLGTIVRIRFIYSVQALDLILTIGVQASKNRYFTIL